MPDLRVLAKSLDSLYLGFYGDLESDTFGTFAEAKMLAKGLDMKTGEVTGHGEDTPTDVGGWQLSVKPHGYKNYNIVFYNADVRGRLFELNKSSAPNIYLILASDLLWREGSLEAYQLAQDWVFRVTGDRVKQELVSRVDLAMDFQGWQPDLNELNHYVCRATFRQAHQTGTIFTGYTFGRGHILCRLYHKTVETKIHQKPYFAVVWEGNSAYDPKLPVWRLEFQLRRPVLLEFGIDTPADLFRRLNGLWRYCCNWVRYTTPLPDNPQKARWPTAPPWAKLSRTTFNLSKTPVLRERRIKADLDRMISMLLGCLTTYAALKNRSSVVRVLGAFEKDLRQTLERRGLDFKALVHSKLHRIAVVKGESS